MTERFFPAVALAIATLVINSSVRAEDLVTFGSDMAGESFCGDSEPAHGAWSLDSELLLLRLHTSGGTSEDNVFGFDPAYRFTFGYTGVNGVGIRTLFFDYDHQGVDPVVGQIDLNAYNLDVELFKRIQIGDCSTLEMSGGIRYNDTHYFYDTPTQLGNFYGLGGTLGVRGATAVGRRGELFARGKFALLGGNGAHDGDDESLNPAHDMARDQVEIAIGYQHNIEWGRFLITPEIAGEWQKWGGYNIDPVDEHPEADLLLAGFTFGLGVSY